ncbi:MAG: ATP-binding protein [Planctomycetota bacterium]|jgi:anti-sigma regulatory factor (Ser/Thr protein kinase)/nucleoid DNA-binding protein
MASLGQKDLADRIAAAEMSVSSEQVNKILTRAFSLIREELLEGTQVKLPDFATIRVAEKKAEIVVDPESGHKYVRPAAKAIHFQPESSLTDLVSRMRLAAIMLVVPKNDQFAKVIEYHFSRVGWKVHVLENVKKAREMIKDSGAYLIILDVSLNGAGSLIEDIKCVKDTNSVPLIALYPKGIDPNRTAGYSVCADESIVEPFEVYNLLMLAESELARTSEEELFFEHQVSSLVTTDDKNLEKLFKSVENLFQQTRLDDDGRISLMAAFREAVTNAAKHGNGMDAKKQISINYLLDSDKITAVITDEGKGFDHLKYLNRGKANDAVQLARQRHDANRLGGLGIMLMVRTCNNVRYNDIGNQITLTKKLPPKES